ncbi:MAG: hypothetical protein KatS3mg005_4143 [Bryobacteraceae bacterium]|nr:MAG: hypothetical protein KatS3mg005_4143 [Bryobacteraceae bacterium]
MARSMKKRNPAAAAKEQPFPHFLPDYPVKPWVDPATGERFQTVSVDLPDGTFLAFVAEAPEVRATAKTRGEAERAVLAVWRRPESQKGRYEAELRRKARENPEALTEDEAEWLYFEKVKDEPWVPAEKVLKEYGYGLDGRPLKKG